jgi:hypothetical protein
MITLIICVKACKLSNSLGSVLELSVIGINVYERYSKCKVKLSLCLIKHLSMKAYWGVDIQLHVFLTSALDGGQWSASRHCRFTLEERTPGTHWIGGWVGP